MICFVFLRSFTYINNNSGLGMVPCGTPQIMSPSNLVLLSNAGYCLQFFRQFTTKGD